MKTRDRIHGIAVLAFAICLLAVPQGSARAQGGRPTVLRPGGTALDTGPNALPAEFTLSPREPASPVGGLFFRFCRYVDVADGIAQFATEGSAVGFKIKPIQKDTNFSALFVINCQSDGVLFTVTQERPRSNILPVNVRAKFGDNNFTFSGKATRAQGSIISVSTKSRAPWKFERVAIRSLN